VPRLREQFDKAGLGLWDNRWSEVYDFTPSGGAANSANVGLGVTHLSLDVKVWEGPKRSALLCEVDIVWQRGAYEGSIQRG
jgi:hypothetical protein